MKSVGALGILCLALGLASSVAAGPYSESLYDYGNAYDPGIPGFVGPAGDGKIGWDEWGNPLPGYEDQIVNPVFIGWAATVVDYSPSPDEPGLPPLQTQPQWQHPEKALGPVTGDNFDIVSLGDLREGQIAGGVTPGQITLGFDAPIGNGEGPDFAVFENGFISGGGSGVPGETFAELAYVEVSTNGADFARFAADSLTSAPVGPYGTIDPTNVYNLAGKHVNAYGDSWGTPFDLQTLVDDELVTLGLVVLDEIQYVRIVDIPGTGDWLDAGDDSIYDAWWTFGSGGLDLEAVGIINPSQGQDVLEPVSVVFFGTGLTIVIGCCRRRRMRKNAGQFAR